MTGIAILLLWAGGVMPLPPAPPPNSRLWCLPPYAVADANRRFAAAYGDYCRRRYAEASDANAARWWEEATCEAHRCWDLWDDLARAWLSQGLGRDYWLSSLRSKLGEDDWWAGRMPPPAPWWRFVWRE